VGIKELNKNNGASVSLNGVAAFERRVILAKKRRKRRKGAATVRVSQGKNSSKQEIKQQQKI